MKYYLLGKSGLRVSEVALGTMTFGEEWGWGANKADARRIYDAFRDRGGNFIDTANLYTNGTSETYLGEFVQGHRESVVLATKYTNAAPGLDPNSGGNHRKSMVQAVEASLRRLRTEYIDLYWVHIWDKITPAEEVMRGLDDLVRQGKILYTGISDAPAWWIAKSNVLADLKGWSPFVGLQIEYSLLERTPERELLPMADDLQLGVTAWSPLAGGVLSGKYRKNGGKDGRYVSEEMRQFQYQGERTERVLDAVEAVSREHSRSMPQIALAWLRHRPDPVIPILGAKRLEQLEDNLESLDVALSGEQVERLNQSSAIELGFPHDFLEKDMVRTFVYGGMLDRIIARRRSR